MIYVYRCADCETEQEVIHGVHDELIIKCPDCGAKMERRPQRVRVNWNGRKPSRGDWSSAQREIIEGAPRRRAEAIPHKNTTIARLEREAERLGG